MPGTTWLFKAVTVLVAFTLLLVTDVAEFEAFVKFCGCKLLMVALFGDPPLSFV